jgi:IclR family transcriptional regulator, KDG regulon repressor
MQIQSLERAIGILNLFRNSGRPLGISEMAEKLGLAKTTVHGLVSTLEKNGFLLKDTASRKYRLGFALFELGSLQMADLEINQRVFQPLHRLADQNSRLCRVAIWDRGSILVTMTAHPQGHESTARQFGPRLPGYCTALGKAILGHMQASELQAYLEQIELIAYTPNTITDRRALEDDLLRSRARGYSISRQEILIHQVGIGAPLLGAGGAVIGAISMRLGVEDLDTDFMTSAANELIRTAFQISVEMGYQPLEIKALHL